MERAKLWNDWTEDELMSQLAGHLRGQAHQEWSLLGAKVKASYHEAVKALRLRLDQVVAPWPHKSSAIPPKETPRRSPTLLGGWSTLLTLQRACQSRRKIRYCMASSRMHLVLKCTMYQELCLPARNEERRLAELKKRQ